MQSDPNTLVTIIGPVIAGAGGLAGVWWRLHLRLLGVHNDLQTYKLQVAEKYASVGHLMEVEERLVKAIDKLTSRIDELIKLERRK